MLVSWIINCLAQEVFKTIFEIATVDNIVENFMKPPHTLNNRLSNIWFHVRVEFKITVSKEA